MAFYVPKHLLLCTDRGMVGFRCCNSELDKLVI